MTPGLTGVFLSHDLFRPIGLELLGGYEVAHLQLVVLLAAGSGVVCVITFFFFVAVFWLVIAGGGFGLLGGGLHFKEVFFCKEAPEAQQRLIHSAQLVDAELGVTHPPTPFSIAFLSERHQLDHLAQHHVAEAHAGECGHALGVKQVRLQGGEAEAVVEGSIAISKRQLGCGVFPFGVALPNHLEQLV